MLIAILLLLMTGAVVYAVTRKREGYSFDVGIERPAISIKPVTLLYTDPAESFAFALSFPEGCYIGDVDMVEKEKMNAAGFSTWSPIIPTIPFDKGDYLYVKDGDIKMATLDISTYPITPTTDNYT